MVRETKIATSQQKQHESNQIPYMCPRSRIGDLIVNVALTLGQFETITVKSPSTCIPLFGAVGGSWGIEGFRKSIIPWR